MMGSYNRSKTCYATNVRSQEFPGTNTIHFHGSFQISVSLRVQTCFCFRQALPKMCIHVDGRCRINFWEHGNSVEKTGG